MLVRALRAAGAGPFLGVVVGRRENCWRAKRGRRGVTCATTTLLAALHACAAPCAASALARLLDARMVGVLLAFRGRASHLPEVM
jgi:hypothetical protein